MAGRPSLHHIVPESGRVCVTLNARRIKDLRKISIDLGVPEREVLELAVDALIRRYRELDPEEIDRRGKACFLELDEDVAEIE